MARLNRTVSRLLATTVGFSMAAATCLYLAWRSDAAARPLWAVIAALIALVGTLTFQCYRGRRS